jgi:maleylpyruvate isomerase
VPSVRPDAHIDGVLRSHARLLETVAGIDDATARRPSLLPGWDVAMVVTHLARNADGHAWAAEGARLGESRQRYPSREAREAGILEGRGRPAAVLLDDFRASARRLEEAWSALPADGWAVTARSASDEPEPLVDLPLYRWRETEIHHADLGLAFTPAQWDPAFVAVELATWVPGLERRLPDGTGAVITSTETGQSWRVGDLTAASTVAAPSWQLLAWIAGRESAAFPELAPWEW